MKFYHVRSVLDVWVLGAGFALLGMPLEGEVVLLL